MTVPAGAVDRRAVPPVLAEEVSAVVTETDHSKDAAQLGRLAEESVPLGRDLLRRLVVKAGFWDRCDLIGLELAYGMGARRIISLHGLKGS